MLLEQKSLNDQDWKEDIFEAFKAYDTNGAGKITMKDLRRIMLRTGEKLTHQECKFDLLLCLSFVLLKLKASENKLKRDQFGMSIFPFKTKSYSFSS